MTTCISGLLAVISIPVTAALGSSGSRGEPEPSGAPEWRPHSEERLPSRRYERRPTFLIAIAAALTVAIRLPASHGEWHAHRVSTGVAAYSALVAHILGHQPQDDVRLHASGPDGVRPSSPC
jgi:hypothetical protein